MHCRHVVTSLLHAATNICLLVSSSKHNDVREDAVNTRQCRVFISRLSGVRLWAVLMHQTLWWNIGVESRACNKCMSLYSCFCTSFYLLHEVDWWNLINKLWHFLLNVVLWTSTKLNNTDSERYGCDTVILTIFVIHCNMCIFKVVFVLLQLSYVAEDDKGKIVGYVLAKM